MSEDDYSVEQAILAILIGAVAVLFVVDTLFWLEIF